MLDAPLVLLEYEYNRYTLRDASKLFALLNKSDTKKAIFYLSFALAVKSASEDFCFDEI